MFTGFGKGVLPFFLDLRFHNSKEFMDANRERYQKEVRAPFYAFIEALGPKMQLIDPDFEIRPAKCLSRINRDTRFSKDKSPYRDHLWVAFRQAAMDKDGLPFYWIEIRPESVNWGLGVWGENRGMMDAMRRRMAAQPEDYLRLLPFCKAGVFRSAAGNGRRCRFRSSCRRCWFPGIRSGRSMRKSNPPRWKLFSVPIWWIGSMRISRRLRPCIRRCGAAWKKQ